MGVHESGHHDRVRGIDHLCRARTQPTADLGDEGILDENVGLGMVLGPGAQREDACAWRRKAVLTVRSSHRPNARSSRGCGRPTGSPDPRGRRRTGNGMCGVVMRTHGPSRSQKASSPTIDAISAPQPQRRGFSSTVKNRPVLVADSRSVLVSSGTRDRTSMTSAEIPSPARRSAASSARGTIERKCGDRDIGSLPHDLRRAELVDDLAIGNRHPSSP